MLNILENSFILTMLILIQRQQAEGIDKGFPVSNFNLVKKHIKQSLYLHNLEIEEINKISEKGFIFLL